MKDQEPVGPIVRPDSAPVHPNKLRAFREELRLDREQFSALIEASVDTERGWENGTSVPKGAAALKIFNLARKNFYPLTLEDIVIKQGPSKKPKRRGKNGEGKSK